MKLPKIYFGPVREPGISFLSSGVKISLFIAIFLPFLLVGFQTEAADKENCLM